MKNLRKIIIAVIAILSGAIYVSQTYLEIDLIGLFLPDTVKPEIDISALRTTITVGGVFDYSSVSCDDNRDLTCDVEVVGSIDTSIPSTQTITFKATDLAGNEEVILFEVNVIEGLDTTMYVPAGYYDGIEGLTGEALKNALNDIISNHIEFPYTDDDTDVWDLLRDADEDPNNSNNVLLFYSDFSWPKDCQDTRTDLLPDYCFDNNDREAEYIEWNREHIWSKSHGDFEEEVGYEFENKSGGYALGAHTDGHHLVAAERRAGEQGMTYSR